MTYISFPRLRFGTVSMQNKAEIQEELWCEGIKNGHTLQSRAHGGSMSPFIRSGSILTIQPAEGIYVGDVVVFQGKGGLVNHRVIKKRKVDGDYFFVTKGDRVRTSDGWLSHSQVVGKVVEIRAEATTIRMDCLSMRVLNYFIALLSPFLPQLLTGIRKIKNIPHYLFGNEVFH